MDIFKEIVMILLLVGVLGTLFNLFAGAELEAYFKERTVFIIVGILYVMEIVGCHYLFKWDRESADERRRTAYVIHIEPDGETCEGRYYSGKNSPITVKCLDGRTYIAHSIQVIKEIKLKHPMD